MISLLYWQFNSQQHSSKALLPVYFSKKIYYQDNTSYFKTVFPIYWSHSDKYKTNKTVFPLVWSLKNDYYKSFTFIPFISKGQACDSTSNHLMISLLYWQFNSQRHSSKTLLPLYFSQNKYYQDDTSYFKTVFPIYWSYSNNEKTKKMVFPLVWSQKNKYYKSFTFIPFISKGQTTDSASSRLMLSMMYWQYNSPRQDSKTLFPVYFSKKNFYQDDTTNFNTMFPVYWSYNNNRKTNKVVFPLVWSLKNEYYKSFTFIPFISKGRTINDMDYLIVTPLYWKLKNKVNSRTLLFPFYSNYNQTTGEKRSNILLFVFRHNETSKKKSNQLLWPLIELTRDSDYNYFRLAPLVWYKKTSDTRFFSIQPIYYVSITPEFENHHILWQLYTSKKEFGYKKSKTVLWKVFYKDKYMNTDYETRFLYLIYANVKKDGKIEKSYFPFIHKSEDNEGNKSFSAMFYFYNKVQKRIYNSDDFYKEEKIFWFIRIRSNYKALKSAGKIENRIDS
jgi:hypothetical protein